MTRLGPHQLALLMAMTGHGASLLTPDAVAWSLYERGLLCHGPDGGLCITADGLRALADAIDDGRAAAVEKRMAADDAARRKKRVAR